MGKKILVTDLKNNKHMKNLPVPPGFMSFTSFKLKRIEKGYEETDGSKDYLDGSKEDPLQIDTMVGLSGNDLLKRSLRHRPWILFDGANHKSEESDHEQFEEVIFLFDRFVNF